MKFRVSIFAVNLAVPGIAARVMLGRVASAVISANKSSGTWAAANLPVKRCCGGISMDFATARSITYGSPNVPVVLSSADLEGATEIVIEPSTTESGYVDITMDIEQDDGGPPPRVLWPGTGTVVAVA